MIDPAPINGACNGDDEPDNDNGDDNGNDDDNRDPNSRHDLSGTVTSIKAPTLVVQGQASAAVSLKYTLTNAGTQSFEKSSASTVRAYPRPHDANDDSRDVAISESRRESLRELGLGKSRSGDLRVKVPAALAPGEYQFIVKFDDSGSISENNERNNTLRTGRTLRIDAPTVDLAVSGPSISTSVSRRGVMSVKASFVISNAGNTGFKGAPTVQLSFVNAQGNTVGQTVSLTKKMDLKSGRSQEFSRVEVMAPTVPGVYTLVIRAIARSGTADLSAANDMVSQTITVS